jgi:hypothetical protein
MQNTSHAVMAQRVEPKDSADDFPTPPWATRACVPYFARLLTNDIDGLSMGALPSWRLGEQ